MPPCGSHTFCSKRTDPDHADPNDPWLIFYAIYFPWLFYGLLLLSGILGFWVYRKRAKKREVLLARSGQEFSPHHPRLFRELNDTHVGTTIIELEDIASLPDDTVEEELNESAPFISKDEDNRTGMENGG